MNIHEKIDIIGLDCPDCASKLENSISKMDGIEMVSLNYSASKMVVDYESEIISLENIHKRIRNLGYDIQSKDKAKLKANPLLRSPRLTLTIASGIFIIFGAIFAFIFKNQPISNLLFLFSTVFGGVYALRSAYISIISRTIDTNFLMTVAAIGAICLGQYYEAAMVMFLFSIGSTLEAYTVDKTRHSIDSLLERFPEKASVRRNGNILQLSLDQIEINDIVVVKPGESIPVDGVIIDGQTEVDESPVTGESVYNEKSLNDIVYAGTINGTGAVEIKSTSRVEDNTLSRIINMVEQAQSEKAPSQQFSDKFGVIYTPVVVFSAIILGVFGSSVFGGTFSEWIYRSLTLLVVSCPCALVISTPVAIVAAIGNAAKSGILIKGGIYLEKLGDVDIIAFDKTGTLTQGKPSVSKIISFDNHNETEVLTIAAAIENKSEHSIAESIVSKAAEFDINIPIVSDFISFPGKGAKAIIDGSQYFIGSRKLMYENGYNIPNIYQVSENEFEGANVSFVCDDKKLIGAIVTKDTLRENTKDIINQIKSAGIKNTLIITGDNEFSAKSIAFQSGINSYRASLLPQEKLDIIKSYAKTSTIAMIGDGINDAPALAYADVGIAMGGIGSKVAIEAADITLLADDLAMLPYAIKLSKKSKRIIKQNIIIALLAVVILLVGAFNHWISLATGVIVHEGSALLVIGNSMRLLKH